MSKRKRIRQLEAQVAILTEQKRSLVKRLEDRDKTIADVRKAVGLTSGFVAYGGGGGGGSIVRLEP
jgi:flagellar biosynthesis/type III secretory pathway chaperone